MSDTQNSQAGSGSTLLQLSSSDRHQRWRLIKDKLAGYLVVIGGLSIIVAIVLIFFYLLYVVFPLVLPARIEPAARYDLPGGVADKTLFLAMEEQNEVAARVTDAGRTVFFQVADGQLIEQLDLALSGQVTITSFAHGGFDKGVIAFGLSDGRAIVLRHDYKLSYPGGKRVITPSVQYPLGKEPLVVDTQGRALTRIALKVGDSSSSVLAKTADNRLVLASLTKKESLFDDEVSWEHTDATLDMLAEDIEFMLLDKELRNLYLLGRKGELTVFDVTNKSQPVIKHRLNVLPHGKQVTSAEFLNGDVSLLIGDSGGELSQWIIVRDAQNKYSVQRLRAFDVSDAAIMTINPEQRRKGLLVVDAKGTVGIYNTTAERELINQPVIATAPVAAALSPRANAFLLQDASGAIHRWGIENEHPEISWKSLWSKVWYENYSEPAYIWQSSAASSDFEPKMSLTPLVFGTIKASFYAMLIAIPLALFGAIYTGYFMTPRVREYVKPGIEIMGALPTVILGFLAGLWLAPFVETHLTAIFALFLVVPLGVMLFAYLWYQAPETWRHRIPDGWDAILAVPVIVVSAWLAFAIAPTIESLFFAGDLRTWMRDELGIGYDQRNTLVVGLALGFAVIPMIFSIAEDAIFSVPKHLTTGSLALGATPWQTLIKVVILTASPGIFSAVMIGFGRAVGETMIVLMATGNTPVMDFSIFQGLRTLAANIAVEMPESEFNSTHYRVLFLAALVLFLFTFVVNSLAEVVRQNLRQKYSSL
ncbi:MAG: ABC transporter permease subunit [Methylomonas sp.]|nr:ABC transporter permease subunit [Methylomonas sp.]PPD22808.1 MAG: phosphate ABC transporter permease [Methylomonas sp.]PPD25920.1 MAG: phosphate ABC transporter permease [Methylomonas sp.]PPD37653.1 MAG: phosphate ABC transporter permease [Methylomonas sp.]PPD42755.1 MAG: phosphate ABC transporter permease [Methylomonas sp.]